MNSMTDKVQKIKQWISREQDGLMDAQCNFEYPEHQGAYGVLCNLDAYIDSLQEEPVSKEDFEMALTEMVAKAQKCVVEPWVVAAQWKDELIKLVKSEEPVSIWHDANRQPDMYRKYLVRYSNGRVSGSWERHDDGFIPWKDVVKEHGFTHWCYVEDLLKL